MATLKASTFNSLEDAAIYHLELSDKEAEQARMRHLTPGSGQAMVYEIKYQEALLGHGDYIEIEAEALEVPLQEVIDSIIAARIVANQKIALIEGRRLRAKKLIRNAANAAEMHEIIKSLKAELKFI